MAQVEQAVLVASAAKVPMVALQQTFFVQSLAAEVAMAATVVMAVAAAAVAVGSRRASIFLVQARTVRMISSRVIFWWPLVGPAVAVKAVVRRVTQARPGKMVCWLMSSAQTSPNASAYR